MSPAALLAAVAGLALSWAAQPPAPAEFEARFTDGGSLRVQVLDEAIVVATKYGKLTVPLADLRRVEFGFRYPPGAEAKVAALVGRLGADAFRDREEAERQLVGLKELALPAVRRAAKSTDPEVARRAEAVARKLLAVVPEDRQEARDFDVVETAEFTVRGRVEAAKLRVRSRQFGEAAVPVEQLRAIRGLAGGAAAEQTVDAARYARLNWAAWYDTGVDVTADGPLEVTAAGTVDQWPQEPGRYVCGPAGNGMAAVPGPAGSGRTFPSGMLVGRIGPAGPAFPVGPSHRAPRAGQSGRLYLIVAPSHWGNDTANGGYKVTVRAGD
ncbi:MAG: hypothetical protein U0871_21635 [Gemmataceae bacterium]